MKVKLYANNLKWASLEKRVIELEKYLSSRYERIYGKVEIDIDNTIFMVPETYLISNTWFTENIIGTEYDSYCLLIDRKDWKGQKDLLGKYEKGKKKLGFYLVCGEKEKVLRTDGVSYIAFEEAFEHELFHAVYDDLGCKLKYEWADLMYLPGFDNTHYYAYKDKHNIEATYKEIYERWDRKGAEISAIIKKIQNSLPQNVFYPLVKRKSEQLIEAMKVLGFPIIITETYRSFARQNELYAQGRTKPGAIVTNAKGGESFHNYGVAFDCKFVKEGYNAPDTQWLILGKEGEKLGLEWGGRWVSFRDKPHFQLLQGYALKDFQTLKVDYSKFV